MILIIYAHPYPHHSHANKRMLEQAGTLENVEIRSLYHLYPDFNIDVAAEQEALSRAPIPDLTSFLSRYRRRRSIAASNGCRRLPCTARSFAMTTPYRRRRVSINSVYWHGRR